MHKDRSVICKTINRMLENPDDSGIFPMSTAHITLEHYIESVRSDAIAQTHVKICGMMDESGEDPRLMDVGILLSLVSQKLGKTPITKV